MRLVIDSLIVVMVLGILGGVLYLNRQEERGEQQTAEVIDALNRLRNQTAHHAAIGTAIAGRDTVLVQVLPSWFHDDVPFNGLLGTEHPWIDLAPPGDGGVHPPDPVATRPGQAGFWYNPTTGVFRARVPAQLSEAETLALYNQINGTTLDAFDEAPDPARTPLAYTPGTTPSTSYASPAAEWIENAGTAELERPRAVITAHVDAPETSAETLPEIDPDLVVDLEAPAEDEPDSLSTPLDSPEVEDIEPAEDPEDRPGSRPTLPRTAPAEPE